MFSLNEFRDKLGTRTRPLLGIGLTDVDLGNPFFLLAGSWNLVLQTFQFDCGDEWIEEQTLGGPLPHAVRKYAAWTIEFDLNFYFFVLIAFGLRSNDHPVEQKMELGTDLS